MNVIYIWVKLIGRMFHFVLISLPFESRILKISYYYRGMKQLPVYVSVLEECIQWRSKSLTQLALGL